jgi:hypothetical protein
LSKAQSFGHHTKAAFVAPRSEKIRRMRFQAALYSVGDTARSAFILPSISQNHRRNSGEP